jgi:hypothetical protein
MQAVLDAKLAQSQHGMKMQQEAQATQMKMATTAMTHQQQMQHQQEANKQTLKKEKSTNGKPKSS